jgi:dihydrodipicolinate synthase/N-acetylneuraminate lyase
VARHGRRAAGHDRRVCGPTPQALGEAELAVSRGYDAGLLSLSALGRPSNDEVLEHCRRVADVIPLVGFYLQPAVGGRVLDRDFWRRFLDIERVVAIKVAPFDRYRTLDVVGALARERAP